MKPTDQNYKPCFDYWYYWYKDQTGLAPKIDGSQGKALKQIISYFNSNFTTHTPLQCLQAVLDNWNRLSSFNQQFRTLREINSRLNNILAEIKNGQQPKSLSDQNKRNLSEMAARAAETLRGHTDH